MAQVIEWQELKNTHPRFSYGYVFSLKATTIQS